MKVYIAGPMRGYPRFNFPAFYAAEDFLTSLGYTIANPAKFDAETFDIQQLPDNYDWREIPEGMDLSKIIRRDIDMLLRCDAIYLLEGWERSSGANAEYAVAKWAKLHLMYEKTY